MKKKAKNLICVILLLQKSLLYVFWLALIQNFSKSVIEYKCVQYLWQVLKFNLRKKKGEKKKCVS